MTSPADGLVPWDGKAGDLRVGHIVQGATKAKKDVWEVIDTANPNQYDLGQTPWFRVRRLGTEEIVAIPPKTVRERVTYMLTPEEFAHAEMYGRPPFLPKTWPADAEAVGLLVEELGATMIAQRDEASGEIWCPAYATGATATGWRNRQAEQLEHLKVCHGMDVSALEELDPEAKMHAFIKHHGEAHRDNLPGGFPHRHAPEDLTNL